MKSKLKRGLSLLLSLILICSLVQSAAAAAFSEAGTGSGDKAKRTILFYVCGSDLETESGLASFNIRQVLKSNFSAGDDVKFIVMTGGSLQWNLESEYLSDPNGLGLSVDEVTGEYTISSEYNQLWEAKGADAAEDPGKLVLLDADGITGEDGEAAAAEDEMMGEYTTLQAFINYGAEHYPADKYDLILWDHGSGPMGDFAVDQHNDYFWGDDMSFAGIVHALSDNKVVDPDGDSVPNAKFDFINFDACLMGNVEMAFAYADYADYYICSADYVPGQGEYYTDWLNKLGEDPDFDTYELGKIMVDSFYDFYTYSDYAPQDGTLAVIDLAKLSDPQTGFIDALNELSGLLSEEVDSFDEDGNMRFYDEWASARNAVQYGTNNYYDLGQFAALLGIVNSEVSEANLASGEFDDTNAYTEVSQKLQRILSQDGDNDLIYSKVTDHEKTGNVVYRAKDGEIAYGEIPSTGLYIYFPVPGPDLVFRYQELMNNMFAFMQDSERKECLNTYINSLLDYGYIQYTAKAVFDLINAGMDKSEITFDKVMELWNTPYDFEGYEDQSYWTNTLKKIFDLRPGGGFNDEMKAWLDQVVIRQAEDAIAPDNVTANRVITDSGDAYEVNITDSKKRYVKSVGRNVYAELPAVEAYKELVDEDLREDIEEFGTLKVGKVYGDLSWPMPYPTDLADLDYLKQVINWYNDDESAWSVPELEQKWYAVKDADGNNHAASIYSIKDNYIIIPAYYGDDVTDQHPIYLKFEKEHPEDQFGKLIVVFFVGDDGVKRGTYADALTGELNVWTMVSGSHWFGDEVFIPITENSFKINKDNAGDISIIFTDIADISDIRDVDDDGSAFDSTVIITDIYDNDLDITDKIVNPEFDVCDIDLAQVRSATLIGDELKLEVTHDGEILEEGLDYTWEKKNPNDDLTVPGEYEIILIGKGKYVRRATKTITVKTGLLGDADLNGEVDITDATTIRRYDALMIEFSEAALTLGDVDKDGEVCIIDATWIQRWDIQMNAPEGIGEPIGR